MIVKHRDRELLRFRWLEPEGIQILSVNEAERKFLPLEFADAHDERMLERRLEAWLKNRTAPMGRHFIRFRRHPHYNWPTEKLEEIERFLQKRIDDIFQYRANADKYLEISINDVGVKNKIPNENVGVNLQDLDPLDLQILWNMKSNRFITGKELAAVLGREERTVERHIKSLREANIVNRLGADKNGYWDVLAGWD